ncbi:hypothetical protein [Halomonas sp. AOP43-D1-4]|uniref:hypothetical protein n=1 Tax=Halomonas sp. AOP43-D1-4 TaxID=3457658 RepID=UPI0040331DF1
MAANVGDLIRRTQGLWEFIEDGGEGAKRLSELQRELVETQIRETALVEENAALKKTIADFEKFDIERQYYTRQQKPSGAWVVKVRPGKELEADMEKGMEFCAHCFQKRELSILQPIEKLRSPGGYLKCHTCSAEVMLDAPLRGSVDFY